MEWQRDREASPGECAAASAPGGSRTVAVARLESQRTPARLHAARATPMHRGEPVASRRRFATASGRDPLPCAARARSPLVGDAARSQRASPNREPGDDQIVRRPASLCHLTRFGDGVTPS